MTRAVLYLAAALLAAAGGVLSWQSTISPAAGSSSRVPPATADTGRALFLAKGCVSCHTGPDTTAAVGTFPSLASASAWAGERRPGVSAEAYLGESIRSPAAFISPAFSGGGPTMMPDLGLTDEEIDALVHYLLQG